MANAIHYNLYRFGMDESAIAHLINGDFPDDDEERWQMVEAPRYHIRRMLDDHTRAQQALRDCRDSGRPFVLYLRSFSSELRSERFDNTVFSTFSAVPLQFQQSLKKHLASAGIPLVKLPGGSDGLLADLSDVALVVSTNARNWRAVAAELIDAAAAIVFVVSEMSPGVVEELARLREPGRAGRCLVVLTEPPVATGRDLIDADGVRANVKDFANVFELAPDGDGVPPERFVQAFDGLLAAARTEATFQQTLAAQFTYLEPDFAESKDFVETQEVIWARLRSLRAVFEDTYWAAMEARGISREGFTFPAAWKMAHQTYGLAIATGDLVAVQEALSYLYTLYILRNADYALAIPSLAERYRQLATEIHGGQVPDLEARYAIGRDVLKSPRTIDTALDLVEMAQRRDREGDSGTAGYLYQAAAICALRAEDVDERKRKWITANVCGDWAKIQATANQPAWATANYQFAIALFRELVREDAFQYESALAMCLNNFGALEYGRRDWPRAEIAYVEALQIRRGFAGDSRNDPAMLGSSLANLALVRSELGQLDSALALYREAIDVCEKRLPAEREAIVDLTWLQASLSLCLARTSDGRPEARQLAQRASANLDAVTSIDDARATGLAGLIRNATQASAEDV